MRCDETVVQYRPKYGPMWITLCTSDGPLWITLRTSDESCLNLFSVAGIDCYSGEVADLHVARGAPARAEGARML